MKNTRLAITTTKELAKIYAARLREMGVNARASTNNVLLPLGTKIWQAELYKKMMME